MAGMQVFALGRGALQVILSHLAKNALETVHCEEIRKFMAAKPVRLQLSVAVIITCSMLSRLLDLGDTYATLDIRDGTHRFVGISSVGI